MEGYFHQKIKVVLMDVIGSKCVWKSRCDWSTHSAASWEFYSIFTCELVWKIFRPESGVKFFIHEIFHTWNRCEFSIRHVQPCSTCEILNLDTFQTCFWCESGMKQVWSYENILYGIDENVSNKKKSEEKNPQHLWFVLFKSCKLHNWDLPYVNCTLVNKIIVMTKLTAMFNNILEYKTDKTICSCYWPLDR